MAPKINAYDIDLLQLKENHDYEYDFRITKEFFADRDNADILGADVDVHLTVRRAHEAYSLLFECDGELDVACDRCLDPVEVPVGVDYDIRLKFGEEYDDSDETLITLPYNTTRFDVAPLIYDTLLLSVPLRCVHPDGECNADMADALRRHEADENPEEETEI
ncbi:MAG: DUF177 domain-containing protein [Muribaculaceae bacterium]|nr:DUF177 domain-containing protein [Muribaculaceae bacterium]